MSKARVIIYMEGGLIQEIISCDQALEIIVRDYAGDVDTDDEKIIQVDGAPFYLNLWDLDPDPESIPSYLKQKAAIDQNTRDVDNAKNIEENEEVETSHHLTLKIKDRKRGGHEKT